MNGCRTTWSENLAELDFVTAVAPRDQFDHSAGVVDHDGMLGAVADGRGRRVHDDGLPSATAGYGAPLPPRSRRPRLATLVAGEVAAGGRTSERSHWLWV